MLFGETLKVLRANREISQRQLAGLLGMDGSYLSRVENDRPNHLPGVELIELIAKHLKLSVTERDRLFGAARKLPPEVSKRIFAEPEHYFKVIRERGSL